MILRPGIQALLADARSGTFDVVVAEALDRMSRDQSDISALFKHLQFARVMIVTLSEGEINKLLVGPKSTMNALFLKDLAAKTHRSLRGRVEKGRSGGEPCFGYDAATTFDNVSLGGCGGSQPPRPTFYRDSGLSRFNLLIYRGNSHYRAMVGVNGDRLLC